MNLAHLIVADDFQKAWLNAVEYLSHNHWEQWSLIVQINESQSFSESFEKEMITFADYLDIFRPKKVAYTIFPYGFHTEGISREYFYKKYIRYYNGVRKKLKWGTYFHRMIAYNDSGKAVNQIENIIRAIKSRSTSMKAAYTIVIECPGNETIRKMGAPCLNYLAIQIDNVENSLNVLAVYRNQDFLKKAYGNYKGLCHLIRFLANETGKNAGSLTCISSHAYIDSGKTEIKIFMDKLNGLYPA